MIHFFNPYSFEGDIGKAYNYYASIVPNPEDWICFTDGDTSWLRPDYGHHIKQIVDQNPEAGMFTCLTNRVGCIQQCYGNRISPELNMMKHIRIANDVAAGQKLKVKPLNFIISGHCMIFKKSTWERVGGFAENIGILSVDNIFSQKILDAGLKILLMEGVYIWHKYRLETGINDKSHLR